MRVLSIRVSPSRSHTTKHRGHTTNEASPPRGLPPVPRGAARCISSGNPRAARKSVRQCDLLQKRGGQRKRKIGCQSFSFLRPGPSATQFVAQKTHSYVAVPVGRISQGAAVFCVRNASTSRVMRSMPSRSTSRHFCAATRCRRRCSTTISTGAGSSRRRRSGASARNGDANALHARLRRDGSSVVSVALEPTACSSARLELPPEVVSGSVLVASAQFVSARRFDVAAPRFEARPSRRRRRKDEELLGAFGSATWTTTAVSVPTLELSFRRCIRDY